MTGVGFVSSSVEKLDLILCPGGCLTEKGNPLKRNSQKGRAVEQTEGGDAKHRRVVACTRMYNIYLMKFKSRWRHLQEHEMKH